ncbi:MAG TPA: radical SAM protein, partial [Bryobacteraceae bacterium]|nr:radical SAM protein [Bryobacteraceae bacterium]
TPTECLGHRMAPLVASRGCYGHCAFCCIAAWHEQTMPGKRFRLRPVADVADEMAQLHRERGIELFLFHDDNFFLPSQALTLRRIESLADCLEERGVREFATIVKARPNDLTPEVLSLMRRRLGLIRIYVGIENASDSGLRTLQRGVDGDENHRALELLERFGVFPCFNLLIFEPSTTIADLETNLRFMERHRSVPNNFGRVELYAGTPLLARLQAEGRATGDYLAWNYQIADPAAQNVFEIAMRCFYTRNFSEQATPHRLMQTRFSVEIAARFHPGAFRESWRAEAKRLARVLTADSVGAMREIIAFVESDGKECDELDFSVALAGRMREVESCIDAAAIALDREIHEAVGLRAGVDYDRQEQQVQPAG